MTKQEKIEALDNMLICYVDRTNLTNEEVKETEDFVEELKKAINFTDSSLQLYASLKIGDKVIYRRSKKAEVIDVPENGSVRIKIDVGEHIIRANIIDLELSPKSV